MQHSLKNRCIEAKRLGDDMSKAKAGTILIVIIAAIALVPIALYGTQVDVATVSLGLSVGGPLVSASSTGVNVLQIPSFTAGLSNAQVEVSSMNPYEYMAARNTARTQVVNEGDEGDTFVEITITFNLTTPSNNSLVFVLTPGRDQGTGDRTIQVLLGPEDGLTSEGEFYLSITITVKVTPPGFDQSVVDITLDPVNLMFSVQHGSP